LKECLSEGNAAELLAAVSGKSVREAREALAARFPRPDVPTSLRKLPERRAPQHAEQLQPQQLQNTAVANTAATAGANAAGANAAVARCAA
jgi:hypothetical protein